MQAQVKQILLCSLLGLLSLSSHALAESGLPWQSYNRGLTQAKSVNKAIMIQFYGESCHDCHRMAQEMQADPQLHLLTQNFILIRINVNSDKALSYQGQQLSEMQFSQRMLVPGTPTLVFLNPQGQQLGRRIGYTAPQDLKRILTYYQNKARG